MNQKFLEKIKKIKKEFNDQIWYREKEFDVLLLALLTGENVFLYGPAGTGKTHMANIFSKVFKDAKYFEKLIMPQMSNDELFGPYSVSKLKQEDAFERKIDGYLPTANIAFLDEIWKGSSSLINSLLTLLMDRKYYNGVNVYHSPLTMTMAASNEFPDNCSGLGPMYERFLFRLHIKQPVSQQKAKLLNYFADKNFSFSQTITENEINEFQAALTKVKCDSTIIETLTKIDEQLKTISSELEISARNFQKLGKILRACALLDGRDSVKIKDLSILKDIVWSDIKDKNQTDRVINSFIIETINSINFDNSIPGIDAFKIGDSNIFRFSWKVQNSKKNFPMLAIQTDPINDEEKYYFFIHDKEFQKEIEHLIKASHNTKTPISEAVKQYYSNHNKDFLQGKLQKEAASYKLTMYNAKSDPTASNQFVCSIPKNICKPFDLTFLDEEA